MPTTHYIWDFASDNLLMEKDDDGDAIAEYTNEPGEFGKLISQRRNGQTYFHHYDAQGSTRTVTDENQDAVETATYSPFGETVTKTSSITNPFGFKGALGYYANPETNDLYVRARTLAIQIARWLSRDPLGFIDGINMYTYAKNAPGFFSDPSGLGVMLCHRGSIASTTFICYNWGCPNRPPVMYVELDSGCILWTLLDCDTLRDLGRGGIRIERCCPIRPGETI